MLDSLAQVISALQGLETVFFVVLLCLLHLRLRREQFLVWWIWAWTAYGIALFAWWGTLRPGMPFFPKEALVLITLLGGLLQIPLLIIGASNLPGQKPVEKRTWRLLLGLAVLAAVALYAASKQATMPRAQYAVWFLPRQTLLALGYFVCAGACMRWWQKAKSLGALVMAVSCGGYGVICLGYVGYQALALSYPLAVLLLDVACQNGIALGMVVQLVDAHKKAILARSESETRFGTMAECLGEGLLITDKDDVVLFLNTRLQEMTGYTKAELLGKSAYKYLVAPKQWPAIWQRNQERMKGASESYEIEFRRKDGTFVWTEVHATPYRNHAGEIVGTLGAITDITERKRVEKERERLLRIQTALSQAGKALLGTLDLDELLGKILEGARQAIPAAEKGSVLLWDETKKTLQVRKTNGYQDPRVAGVVLDVRQGYSVQAALQRKPVIVADVHTEPSIRYAGEIAEMAAIRSALSAPLIARDRLLGVISLDANAPSAFTKDDLELLVAFSGHAALALEDSSLYEQMNQSRETYRIVSDLVSDWAYSFRVEADGRQINEWVTEAFMRISGYTLEEMEALGGWRTLIHPDDKGIGERRLQALMKGDPDVSEYRILTKDGEVRWIRDYGRPVWDAQQKRVVRIYGAAQNITDRQLLESQLRQAQKMEAVGRLAGGVAHDFNNLLMVIRGYTELLLEQLSAESPLRRSAEQIEKAADRAASLTQQLLAYSRRQVLAPQVLDMNAVVEGVHAMLRRLIAEHIELTMALEPALGRVKADRSQVEQVLLNLVINARDAMPKGGKITVETGNVVLDHAYVRQHPGTRPGKHVMLAVSDTGVGIPPEDQAHIFEPFFTTKAAGKGTGLGLATVYGIVKQSDGSIWVYSEPGLGTTFKVYLPRVEDAMEARDAHTEPQASEPRSETILVVEDEEHVRELACQFLGNRGYRVLSAGSGPQALEVSAKHAGTIDVLVTDVIMPGMSGRELAERLTPLRPEMKVLYVSGYTQEAIGHHGVLDPDTAFLQKPFSSETLARKLREILDANGRKQPSSSTTNPPA